MQGVHPLGSHGERASRRSCGGDSRPSRAELTKWLSDAGYTRVEAIEEAGSSRSAAGSSISSRRETPARCDWTLFGDQIERIIEIDSTPWRRRAVDRVHLVMSDAGSACPATTRSISICCPRNRWRSSTDDEWPWSRARGLLRAAADSRGFFGPPAVLKLVEQRFRRCGDQPVRRGASSADARDAPGAGVRCVRPRSCQRDRGTQ